MGLLHRSFPWTVLLLFLISLQCWPQPGEAANCILTEAYNGTCAATGWSTFLFEYGDTPYCCIFEDCDYCPNLNITGSCQEDPITNGTRCQECIHSCAGDPNCCTFGDSCFCGDACTNQPWTCPYGCDRGVDCSNPYLPCATWCSCPKNSNGDCLTTGTVPPKNITEVPGAKFSYCAFIDANCTKPVECYNVSDYGETNASFGFYNNHHNQRHIFDLVHFESYETLQGNEFLLLNGSYNTCLEFAFNWIEVRHCDIVCKIGRERAVIESNGGRQDNDDLFSSSASLGSWWITTAIAFVFLL